MKEKEEENLVYALMPKGLILLALGGYELGGARKQAQEVHDRLRDYMDVNDVAIVVRDNNLDFVKFEIKTENNGR